MVARWRLEEANKRANKRYDRVYGPFEPIYTIKPFNKQRAVGMYRKTTKLCSCWYCSGYYRMTPIPRDLRRMAMDGIE